MGESGDLVRWRKALADARQREIAERNTRYQTEQEARLKRILSAAPLLTEALIERRIPPDLTLQMSRKIHGRRRIRRQVEVIAEEYLSGWTMAQDLHPEVRLGKAGIDRPMHGLMLSTDADVIGFAGSAVSVAGWYPFAFAVIAEVDSGRGVESLTPTFPTSFGNLKDRLGGWYGLNAIEGGLATLADNYQIDPDAFEP